MYRGIQFPFECGETSFPKESTDSDLIKESLIQIILTQRGERVMRSDFGCDTLSIVFENNDLALENRIRTDVLTAIGKWEPRVIVRQVAVTRKEAEVVIDIVYVVIATRQDQRLQISIPIVT